MIWHFFFESLAYAVAFRIYLYQRRTSGDFLETGTRWTIVAAAIGGAAFGSKILAWFEDPARILAHASDPTAWMAGKTMVGGLLGGTLAVEWIKRRQGVTRRTGDLFAIPMAIGIAIGRIGCLLAGIADDTYGLPTNLPWAIDLGDGVRRHPVQIYEMLAMIVIAAALTRVKPPRFAEGDRFRALLLAYCGWRLAVDFLKPGVHFVGLTVIQWTCLAALIFYAKDARRMISSTNV